MTTAYLAKQYLDEDRNVEVLQSAAGWYLGTLDDYGCPNTRESAQYWDTKEAAADALRSNNWTQRMHP